MVLRLCGAGESPQGVKTVRDSERAARLAQMSRREI